MLLTASATAVFTGLAKAAGASAAATAAALLLLLLPHMCRDSHSHVPKSAAQLRTEVTDHSLDGG
jgi:hypothetical protein